LGSIGTRSLRQDRPRIKEAIMMKILMLGAALSALMLGGASAQSSTAPSTPQMKPPAAAPAKPSASTPAAKPENTAPAANQAAATTSKPQIVASQEPDQWLASNFKGTAVLGSNGKKIGEVSDILFDKTGKIEAYVVSFGGFLGMGAKEVAVAPSSFQVVPGKNGESKKLKLSMSEKELKQAQKFTEYKPPRPATTTGAGGPAMGGGLGGGAMGGGMHPPSGPTH
jgi:sporulation protein YlmC with PRC-barrel domain